MTEDVVDTHLLGLDLGGTNIKAAVVAVAGSGDTPRIIHTLSGPTVAEEGPSHVADRMVTLGQEALRSAGVNPTSVGVGVPGLFDYANGTVVFFTNLPGAWEGFPLRTRIATGFGASATLINDARAFTLAEGTIGAGRGCGTLVCMTLGTGVGGGLMIDGKLHFGAFGTAGEIGHQTVDPNGPPCGCGNPGCLESLTRPPYVAEQAGKKTFKDVIGGIDHDDEASRRALATAIDYMAIGLANVFTVIGPDRVVIGGGVAEAGDRLLDPLRAAVRARLTLVPPALVQIVPAELGPFAGAIGAALASQGSLVGDAEFLIGEIPSATFRRSAG